jgi:Rap1a immunity proteins
MENDKLRQLARFAHGGEQLMFHRSRFVAVILCALTLGLPCIRSFAENQNQEIQRFMSLAKQNNGKAFCAPPTTTVRELLSAFAAFSKAHPELNGQINDEQTLRALAERYPCTPSPATPTNATDPHGASQAMQSYRENGYSLTSFSPIFSQLVSTAIPKGFQAHAAYEATLPGPRYMRESVLEGETENQWTQMITITGAKDLATSPQLTPQKFVESMANGYEKRCPTSFSIVGVPTGQISGFEAFSAIVSCGTSPLTGGRTSEAAMILAIKGQQDYYTVQWAERSAPSAAPLAVDTAKWIQRFHALAPIKICPIVPGESPPYPSCVK